MSQLLLNLICSIINIKDRSRQEHRPFALRDLLLVALGEGEHLLVNAGDLNIQGFAIFLGNAAGCLTMVFPTNIPAKLLYRLIAYHN